MTGIDLMAIASVCFIVAFLLRPQPHRETPDQILDRILGPADENGSRD